MISGPSDLWLSRCCHEGAPLSKETMMTVSFKCLLSEINARAMDD